MALNTIGIKLPEKSSTPPSPKRISLRLVTAKDMNAGNDGNGLSVIFRLYKLKSTDAFLGTPYAMFGTPSKEKDAMGSDLLEAREITLSPGQTLEVKETLSHESPYIGVVSLFRAPSAHRWRFAFPVTAAESPGITIGVHACAMTATTTPPINMALSESALLSSAKCE